MNPLLLDTHAFLWFVFDDPRLSAKAAETIADSKPSKLLSIASVWEIVIKVQIGKLGLGMAVEDFFERFLRRRSVDLVPIDLEHLEKYGRLPLHHRDPFDRLVIAQALSLDAIVVTSDPIFARYGLDVIW